MRYSVLLLFCLTLILDIIPIIVYYLSNDKSRYRRLMYLTWLFYYPEMIFYVSGLFLTAMWLTSKIMGG